jgi:hypothetical protein
MDLAECLHDIRARLDALAALDLAIHEHWRAERVLDAEDALRQSDSETDRVIRLMAALSASGALHLLEALVVAVRDGKPEPLRELAGTLQALEVRDV